MTLLLYSLHWANTEPEQKDSAYVGVLDSLGKQSDPFFGGIFRRSLSFDRRQRISCTVLLIEVTSRFPFFVETIRHCTIP